MIAHSRQVRAERLVGHAVLVFAEVPGVGRPRQEQDGEDGHEADGDDQRLQPRLRARAEAAQSRNRAVNLKCSNNPQSATVISVDQNSIQ